MIPERRALDRQRSPEWLAFRIRCRYSRRRSALGPGPRAQHLAAMPRPQDRRARPTRRDRPHFDTIRGGTNERTSKNIGAEYMSYGQFRTHLRGRGQARENSSWPRTLPILRKTRTRRKTWPCANPSMRARGRLHLLLKHADTDTAALTRWLGKFSCQNFRSTIILN